MGRIWSMRSNQGKHVIASKSQHINGIKENMLWGILIEHEMEMDQEKWHLHKNLPTQLTIKQELRSTIEITNPDQSFTCEHHPEFSVRAARQIQLPRGQNTRVLRDLEQ